MAGKNSMNNPARASSRDDYSSSMQRANDTLYKNLSDHEKKLNALRVSNLKFNSNLSKEQQEEIANLSMKLASSVNSYQKDLVEKLSEHYTQEEIKSADMQKKIAKQVQDFIAMEKEKNRASEYKEDLQMAFNLKNAKILADRQIKEEKLSNIKDQYKLDMDQIKDSKKANKRALQDGSKSFKQYYKDRKKIIEEENKVKEETANKLRAEGASELEIMEQTGKISGAAVKEAIFSKETASAVANNLINGLKQMFDSTIQTYGTYQSKVNTRIQGSGRTWQGNAGLGMLGLSLTGGIESNIKNIIGSNPYVKLQAVMDNVVKATEAGIANNIEQRAFLATVSENIASTFDAFDSNLMRVIRLQQSDTTAARLGLEAGLTSLLNSNFLDNSYLSDAFDTVSQNLIEATSQLSAEEAVAVEYNIQKWLGSLYSVGFSSSAVGNISKALGYLGSGDISSLSSDETMQNLIVMAASKANMSYSDLLINGLDSSNTNKLLRSMVEYLAEIADSDNKVVKSEYAKIFGMSVSDLKAVTNLLSDVDSISKSVMSYGGAMSELYSQMGELTSRVSVAGMMQNLYDNVNYSIATSIATNPVTYALWQVTSMIEDLTGGIPLTTISTLGNMVDLNTTVTNLMRAGIVGVSSLGAIGSLISGLGSTFNPSSMLSKLGILNSSSATYTSRGKGLTRKQKQIQQQSGSTYVGNSAGEDYYEQSISSANEQTSQTLDQKKEESTDISLNNIHEYLLSVFDPKITEIEKLVALLAGYSFNTDVWDQKFKSDGKTEYTASTVQIKYSDTDTATRAEVLNSIKDNVSTIKDMISKIISGESYIHVKEVLSYSTDVGLPGIRS
jgi:hypothetical protein